MDDSLQQINIPRPQYRLYRWVCRQSVKLGLLEPEEYKTALKRYIEIGTAEDAAIRSAFVVRPVYHRQRLPQCSSGQASARGLSLMILPPEVRRLIYAHMYPRSSTAAEVSSVNAEGHFLAFFSISRQIRLETDELIFKNTTLYMALAYEGDCEGTEAERHELRYIRLENDENKSKDEKRIMLLDRADLKSSNLDFILKSGYFGRAPRFQFSIEGHESECVHRFIRMVENTIKNKEQHEACWTVELDFPAASAAFDGDDSHGEDQIKHSLPRRPSVRVTQVEGYWTRFLSKVQGRTGIKDQCHDHYFEPFRTALESVLEAWIEKEGVDMRFSFPLYEHLMRVMRYFQRLMIEWQDVVWLLEGCPRNDFLFMTLMGQYKNRVNVDRYLKFVFGDIWDM